jgi:diadenosine tetraphosphate (Ap4A) HIT family hydrolase
MLVIPRKHRESILDIDRREIEGVYGLAKEVAQASARAFAAHGMNVFQNNGRSAGQSEPHFHVHVVPRYTDRDPHKIFLQHDCEVTSIEEQHAIADAIRAALGSKNERDRPFGLHQHMDMTPRAVMETWIVRFNAADVDGLASLYAADAVNHQVALDPVMGREAIRDMFAREFGAARMVCIPEAIHEAGDVIALEWKDPVGLRGCGFFTIKNGLITFQRGYWDKLSFLRLHNLPLNA